MSVFKHFSHGMIYPAEFVMLLGIYDDITGRPWFASGMQAHDEFARFILSAYRKGMVDPDRLQKFCMAAAKRKFSCLYSTGRPLVPINFARGSPAFDCRRALLRAQAALAQTHNLTRPYVGSLRQTTGPRP
jgi:hypothetical protein